MLRRKEYLLILLIVVVSMVVSTAVMASDPSMISVSTGGTGGTYYPLGTAIANTMQEYLDFYATAESTGGSVENARYLSSGETDVAFVESIVADWAYNADNMFKEDQPAENIRGFLSLYPNVMQTIVKKGSGIDGYADLKGKRVAVGVAGGSTPFNMEVVLEAYGVGWDEIQPEYLGYTQSMDLLKDDRVDAVLVDAAPPNASIMDIEAMHDIKILEIEEDKIEKINEKYPFFSPPVVIPGGTYSSIEEDITSTGSVACLFTRAELSEEFVYNMLKTIFEHRDEIVSKHEAGKSIQLESALNAISVPMHPGALKYYKEKGIVE